ncbi:hypothetical protein BHM03_00042768 [Ensete ventricosum]|nr:hypothetical protein BHM03_00042768 [Ensete ventricosum]
MIEQLSYIQIMGSDQAWESSWGSDDIVGPHREFAKRFVEGIKKFARNTSGECRKKTVRLATRLSEVAGLVGFLKPFEAYKYPKGFVLTQIRSVVDANMPHGGGLGSGRRPIGAESL